MPEYDVYPSAVALASAGTTILNLQNRRNSDMAEERPEGIEKYDHPAGGCRMGTDPTSSVCDSFGRTHDHDNLFVVGAPTLPTGGCTNGTLTFAALTLRSATAIVGALKG